MQIKNQNSFTSLCYSEQTNIAGLFKLVRVKAFELYKDAAKNGVEVTGPVYWIYTGMDGRPDTVFNLDIILPVVRPANYQGKFKIKTIEPIRCLFTLHLGAWEKLPETYGSLFTEIGKKNYVPTGICREMYLHMDFDNPANNITEVQVGIQ